MSDEPITVRWTSLHKAPVTMFITSVAHKEEMLADIAHASIVRNAGWKVSISGFVLSITVQNINEEATQEFIRKLIDYYGADYAKVLLTK